jgi:hypothetical protein
VLPFVKSVAHGDIAGFWDNFSLRLLSEVAVHTKHGSKCIEFALCFPGCSAPLRSRRLFCPSDARNSPAAAPPFARFRGAPLAHRYEMTCSRVTGGLPVRSNYQRRRHKHRPVNPLQLHSEASFCSGLLSTVICRLMGSAGGCQASLARSDRPPAWPTQVGSGS